MTVQSIDSATLPGPASNRNAAAPFTTGPAATIAAAPADGQVWPRSGGDSGSSGSAASTRTTTTKTTASLAAGAAESGTVALAAGYRLYRVTTSAPARVRLYTTAAKQTADLARAIGAAAVGDAGVMLEYVSTAGTLAADLSPVVDGFDGKTTPDGMIPITITNTGTGAAAITVTLIWIRTE